MTTITNSSKRRLGLAGRPSIVLNPGESVEVSGQQYQTMLENKTLSRWMESGLLSVKGGAGPVKTEVPEVKKPEVKQPEEKAPEKEKKAKKEEKVELDLPEGVTGEGVELHHLGGGWYEVYVNGFKVTDKKIRKAEAEELAEEYE